MSRPMLITSVRELKDCSLSTHSLDVYPSMIIIIIKRHLCMLILSTDHFHILSKNINCVYTVMLDILCTTLPPGSFDCLSVCLSSVSAFDHDSFLV